MAQPFAVEFLKFLVEGGRVTRCLIVCFSLSALSLVMPRLFGQSVILPMPRLTTTMPLGGQVGTTFEVKITGEYLDGPRSLMFSDPRLVVERVLDEQGEVVEDRFQVTIPRDCALGMIEARVRTRLGVSSPRVFSVSALPEVTQQVPATQSQDAMQLAIPSICNAFMPARSINYYQIQCQKGQRLLIECAAKQIESKLNAVLIVADEKGRDLVVQRRGDYIEFTAPRDGKYYIKIHELTFKGGPDFFFRLKLQEVSEESLASALLRVPAVNTFSWPPFGLPLNAKSIEQEPNNDYARPQKIELPCDLAGAFAKAADVDLYQFEGKKGDVWWVEVGSDRLGCSTDVAVLVQRVVSSDDGPVYEDVVELNDIPSPIKISTNHYAYDGPPYDAGSPDVMGQVTLPEDGVYVLRLVDLFGGTRNDPRNIYRLLVRRPEPDFAVVGWAMHMELRNGDRNAVSKPIALRNGTTMPLEVVVLRRDGFDEPIELCLENLPDGVTAQGIHLARGEDRGILLVTADEGAPAGFSQAVFVARSQIDGQMIEREGHLASMAWPVKDHWQEIPAPRLLQSVVVSVSGEVVSPLSIQPQEKKVWQVTEGEALTIPLVHLRRSEFSGTIVNAKAFGKGLEGFRAEIPIDSDHSEITIDLAKYPLPTGEHTIALYGGAVAKYEYFKESISDAEEVLDELRSKQSQLQKQLETGRTESDEVAEDSEAERAEMIVERVNREIIAAEVELKRCVDRAKAKDIVDIVVSEPIHLLVNAKDKP